jgi:hypothetical protein
MGTEVPLAADWNLTASVGCLTCHVDELTLCCVVLCCVVLCRVVLCRVVLCRVVSCCVVSRRVVLCRVVLCRVVFVALCCVVLCWHNDVYGGHVAVFIAHIRTESHSSHCCFGYLLC